MNERREVTFAVIGSALCLLLSVALSEFFPFPMLLVAGYFVVIAIRIRPRIVWLPRVSPVLLGFVLSPHDAFWLVTFGLVAVPGWIGISVGRFIRRRRQEPASA